MQTFNTPAARRWIDRNYEGAASSATWTEQDVAAFIEEYHVDGLAAFAREVIREEPVANPRTPTK